MNILLKNKKECQKKELEKNDRVCKLLVNFLLNKWWKVASFVLI